MNKKTYIVPVVHYVSFGCEVRVEARNKKEARRLALRPDAEIDGNGYDWDRMNFTRARIGEWQPIKIVRDRPKKRTAPNNSV